jgi:protein-tyrosine phosphatase
MIDLHSHILPGLDDGAASLAVSIDMARAYVAQGVECVACTPHILPGLYHNTGPQIRSDLRKLQQSLNSAEIPLRLVTGADNHMVQNFVARLRDGHLLTLADSRYVLIEPPHHLAPPQLENLCFDVLAACYVPILTHPERLTWIEGNYNKVQGLAARGVWMQVTSGSLLGRFGRRAQYWAERMLSEGLVQILATDAHDNSRRPPDLFQGRAAAERLIGAHNAEYLVATHPMIVLSNNSPKDCTPLKEWDAGDQGHGNDNYAKIYNVRSGRNFVKRLRRFFA